MRKLLGMILIGLLFSATPSVAAQTPRPPLRLSALPAPKLNGPPNGTALQSMGAITLSFQLPAGATQYQVQVTPFNGDGPGANLIRNAESSFTLQPPVLGIGPYVMLPGMTYTWRIRATDSAVSAPETDPSWGPWSDPWSFTTPPPSAESIRPSDHPPARGRPASIPPSSGPTPTPSSSTTRSNSVKTCSLTPTPLSDPPSRCSGTISTAARASPSIAGRCRAVTR